MRTKTNVHATTESTAAVLHWATVEVREFIHLLHTDPTRGLRSGDIAAAQAEFGKNEFTVHETRWWQLLGRQFRSAFIYLLIGAAVLAGVLGEPLDAGLILLFILINAGLGFYQEHRSEKTLQLLRSRTVPRARVIRDGVQNIIPAPELVPGDVIIAEAGDVLPADVRFTDVHNIVLDESILTGESVAVSKTDQPLPPVQDLYQATNLGFGGTHVVSGRGQGVVIATGVNSVFGHLSALTVGTERTSGFERGVQQFSRFILRLTMITLVIVFLAHLFLKRDGLDIGELIIFSIALAVSVIPEAMPLVTTFSLTHGARRLAAKQVLVKRLAAIEELGGIDVLCTDKTGTLTENALRVTDLRGPDDIAILETAALAATLSRETREPNNAFDLAVWQRLTPAQQAEVQTATVIDELPFDPARRRNSVLVKRQGKSMLIVRGAPEAVVSGVGQVSAQEQQAIATWIRRHGQDGNRVLAVATKPLAGTTYEPAAETNGLTLVGLIAFADPIKATTAETIADAHQLGVTVKILTGDSPEVAGAVGKAVGIARQADQVMTGSQFMALASAEQAQAVEQYNVFARVSPEQKHAIIRRLEESHRVGFLGEGINDAPALKTAHVGLVVDSASDIARSAADIILLKKSLRVVVDGIREGRAVFANTVKYITMTLTSNFGNFYAIAFASLLIDFLPMLPLQILLVNLLSDFPMIAIATDRVDPEELSKPRSYDIRSIAAVATLLGLVSTLFDFIFFATFLSEGQSGLQTNWFIGSILTELVLLFSLRSKRFFLRARRPGALVAWLTGIGAALTILIPLTHLGQTVFSFARPNATHFITIGVLVASYFVVSEGMKLLYYRHGAQLLKKKNGLAG